MKKSKFMWDCKHRRSIDDHCKRRKTKCFPGGIACVLKGKYEFPLREGEDPLSKNKKLIPYDVAVIFLHPKCNMTCSFCITEDNFDTMTQAQALELLRGLRQENFKTIVFGGGEPFDWPGDLLSLTKKAKQLGFLVQIGTNAVALPKEYLTIKTIDRYVLPIESSVSEIHNKMRFYKNKHHQLIVDCLQKLRKAKKTVTLSTIITKINKDKLRGLALFLMELNQGSSFIHACHLYKFIPQGRGGRINADKLMISDSEYLRVCKKIKAMDIPFKVYQRKDMYHSKTVDFFWFEKGQLQRGSAGR